MGLGSLPRGNWQILKDTRADDVLNNQTGKMYLKEHLRRANFCKIQYVSLHAFICNTLCLSDNLELKLMAFAGEWAMD